MNDRALILDTETTGLNEPEVIELAVKGPLAFGQHENAFPAPVVRRFKPNKPIEPGAMAVHRIIPADLEGCRPWNDTSYPTDVSEVGYFIGHNIDSDWQALGKPPVKRICTLALAKRVYPDLGSYKLASLIFHLYEPHTAREMTQKAHEAETDIYLTALLLSHILHDLQSKPAPNSWEMLWLTSEEARIPLRIGFSKYGPKNGKPGTLYTEVPTGMLKWIVDPVRVDEMDEWEVKATRIELARRTAKGIYI